MDDTDLPRFDVVIPAFNEEAHINNCLDHVVNQDYPAELVRIFVVDAGSHDRTAALVADRRRSDPRIHLSTGLGRLNAGQALTVGIDLGEAELIARVDAHTYIEPDYLLRSAERFRVVDDDVALIGGQPLQVGETPFGEAVSLARRSMFGVGNSVYADRRELAFVETVQGGVYRRHALNEIGGFSAEMLVSEDEECAFRLTERGYRVLLDTTLRFRYTTRSSWTAVFRQHVNYGRSRVRVVIAHPRSLRWRYLVPSGLVTTLGVLALLGLGSRPARRGFLGVSGLYGTAALVAARAAARPAPHLTGRVAGCFAAQHFGYGLGVMRGIVENTSARLGLGDPSSAVARR